MPKVTASKSDYTSYRAITNLQKKKKLESLIFFSGVMAIEVNLKTIFNFITNIQDSSFVIFETSKRK